eukprot:443138-Rhodomonas_salina.2
MAVAAVCPRSCFLICKRVCGADGRCVPRPGAPGLPREARAPGDLSHQHSFNGFMHHGACALSMFAMAGYRVLVLAMPHLLVPLHLRSSCSC